MVLLDEKAFIGSERDGVGFLEMVGYFFCLDYDDRRRSELLLGWGVNLHWGFLLIDFLDLGKSVGLDGNWGWLYDSP